MSDGSERNHFARYLSGLAATFGTASNAYKNAANDPSNDDFTNYRDASYDQSQTGILGRYKNVNNPQGNSPIATTNQTTISAYTLYPDQEDLEQRQYDEYPGRIFRVQGAPDP